MLTEEWGVSDIIIGLPLHMDGGAGQRAVETRSFIERLKLRLPGVTTHEQDERLSTKAAEDLLRDQSLTPEIISEAARLAAEAAHPRKGSEYKRKVVEGLTRRLLTRVTNEIRQ